jgi:putative transposase
LTDNKEEGIEGLKDKPKCGRTSHLPSEIVHKIRKKLIIESKQGWSTKQVNDMIVEESGIQYDYTHIYRLLHKWVSNKK